jgi:hypothetical protein
MARFDEFSKSLAESCSRRESLRAAGALLAGVVLSRLPLSSAWAKGADPSNCGACGNVCPAEAPFCSFGQCWNDNCGGADLNWDPNNCGACGNICTWGTACAFGVCAGGGGDGF